MVSLPDSPSSGWCFLARRLWSLAGHASPTRLALLALQLCCLPRFSLRTPLSVDQQYPLDKHALDTRFSERDSELSTASIVRTQPQTPGPLVTVPYDIARRYAHLSPNVFHSGRKDMTLSAMVPGALQPSDVPKANTVPGHGGSKSKPDRALCKSRPRLCVLVDTSPSAHPQVHSVAPSPSSSLEGTHSWCECPADSDGKHQPSCSRPACSHARVAVRYSLPSRESLPHRESDPAACCREGPWEEALAQGRGRILSQRRAGPGSEPECLP
jgi:hypothetical protein